jgi:hypothetical protein
MERIAADWQTLSGGVATKAIDGPKSYVGHTALVAVQLELLEDLTIATGIAQHPHTAGYFLQSGVLKHLTALAESLGQLRARGALFLARGEASSQDKAGLVAISAAARVHVKSGAGCAGRPGAQAQPGRTAGQGRRRGRRRPQARRPADRAG